MHKSLLGRFRILTLIAVAALFAGLVSATGAQAAQVGKAQTTRTAAAGPSGTLSGTVTDASTNQPIAGAAVNTSLGSTVTGANGNYSLPLPAGTYDVTYSSFGYATSTQTGVSITDGTTTTVNVALQPSPIVTVSGTVTDGSGHGWPLYARIDVAGDPNGPFFTDPITGHYSIPLPANASYDVTFSPQLAGYQKVEQSIAVGGSNMTQDVQAPVTPDCSAPGYSAGTPCVVVPGGLVEGNVSDLTTGNPLNNATVQSVDNPADKATTFAVPADPNNPGGFYYLFSSLTGPHPFTASASQHADVTATVSVAANTTVRQDFKLGPPAPVLAAQLVHDADHLAPGTALASKAAAIQTAVNSGATATACADITNFLALVQAQTGTKLTKPQAATLTTDAKNLATALGC